MLRRTREAVTAAESFDAFVTDGVSGGEELLLFAVPRFDAQFLNALAVVEAFHQESAIEGDGLGEIYFQR
jgi:hypothetical protein